MWLILTSLLVCRTFTVGVAFANSTDHDLAEDCHDTSESTFMLLQMGLEAQREEQEHVQPPGGAQVGGQQSHPLTQSVRLSELKPLYWVHVPKCGTGIANTILQHDGICPGGGLSLPEGDLTGLSFMPLWKKMGEECGVVPDFYKTATHHAVSELSSTDIRKGHGVIMLRQPEQRLISAYHYLDSFQFWPFPWPPKSVEEYARQQNGCAVKILTAPPSSRPPCFGIEPPSTDDVETAKQMLHTDMAFVGITDEWNLSICLFHAMFGGVCDEREFQNTRPGDGGKSQTLYNVSSELGGFRDAFDGPLYEEATRIFRKNLDLYGVTDANCPSLCSFGGGSSLEENR